MGDILESLVEDVSPAGMELGYAVRFQDGVPVVPLISYWTK